MQCPPLWDVTASLYGPFRILDEGRSKDLKDTKDTRDTKDGPVLGVLEVPGVLFVL
jgi:hypothetical protein